MIKALVALALSLVPAWDHPGFDAGDSYYNPHESVINAGSINDLHRVWSADLRRQDPTCSQPSAPLVSGGRVFATDGLGVSAYRVTDGKVAWRWTFPVPDDALTPLLAVEGTTLLLASGDCHSNSDPNGAVFALNTTTGKQVWHHDLDTPIATFVADQGVAVISGDSPSDALTTIAFRTTDGKQLWAKPDYASSGVSAAGRLLLTHQNTTAAATITTGTIRWTKPTAWTAQAATDTTFLATSGTTLAALSTTNGATLWTAPHAASPQITTDSRHVYRTADRVIESLNAHNGHHQWSRTLPTQAAQPVRAGGLLYTGGPVLNAATGAVVATSPTWATTAIPTGGHLYTVKANTLTAYAPHP